MPDKITTLKLVDNTDVFPNIKDENIPNTIMRIADLSKYLNQLKSINITGDIDSTTITSDIATFTTADISTLNVSGISQFEGEATFGHNVHVDGNIVVNGIDNIVDKGGNKIVNTGTFDPTSDNPAGQKSIEYQIMKADIIARFANAFSHIRVDNSVQYAFAWLPYSDLDLSFIDITYLYYGSGIDYAVNGNYLFNYCRYLKEIPYNPFLNNILSKCSSLVEGFGTCVSLEMIGEYSLSTATKLYNAFANCGNLRHIHLKNIPVSFDISASTRFEENDLVEILNNLVDLTGKTSQTLTMGATNLAKLTDAEKAIATNKNWTLA